MEITRLSSKGQLVLPKPDVEGPSVGTSACRGTQECVRYINVPRRFCRMSSLTNVVIRLITKDDAAQVKRGSRLFQAEMESM